MRLVIIASLAATLLAAAAAPARADGWYFTEGIGGVRAEGALSEHIDSGMAIRFAIGRRIGNLALEGYISPLLLGGAEERYGDGSASYGSSYSALTYGMDLKYLLPVVDHVDLYVRGGLNRMRLEGRAYSGNEDSYAGRGLTYGAGVQVSGKVPVLGFLWLPLFFTDLGPRVTGALWLDTSRQVVRLHDHVRRRSIDGSLPGWTAGVAIGSDF